MLTVAGMQRKSPRFNVAKAPAEAYIAGESTVSVFVIYNFARHNVLDTKKWDTGTVGCKRRAEEDEEGEGAGMNLDTPPPLGQVAVA
jgi:hypothetical protein